MYYLQVTEADKYKVLAENNRINFEILPPIRGNIFDRKGQTLAINKQTYRLIVIPEQTNSVASLEPVLMKLQTLIPLSETVIADILAAQRTTKPFLPLFIKENLSWQEVNRIEVNAPDLPGIAVEVGQLRFYPYAEIASHLIGHVARVSDKTISESKNSQDPLLALPGFRIGKKGIEKKYDLWLRGKAGSRTVEVNAIGRVVQELNRNKEKSGGDLALTIDIDLQKYITKRLAAYKSASVVVMDAYNGDILAMVSLPSYDSNIFNQGISQSQWRDLVNSPYNTLVNKAIAGQYAPGSTFKIVVALAALEQGISPDYTVYCPGHTDISNQRFHCWKQHGRMDMLSALAESCDTWFYQVSLQIGIDKIAAMARKLGLGVAPKIDLGGERYGLIPDKAWKKQTMGKGWYIGETVIASIGQGYVLSTPIQLAVMTARIVNGGKVVYPLLTRLQDVANGVESGPSSELADLNIPRAHLDLVMAGMDAAVNHPKGTANSSAIDNDNYTMAGKTGTSQVRRISLQEREGGIRKKDELAWHLRDHALFVGYAPAQKPRYVCAVVVEHGGSGGKVAAPIARDCLLKTRAVLNQQSNKA